VEEFYKGKTIAVVCPFDAEGGYGFVTRAIAQYLPRYLPGRPKGVPQFRPGANGIVAAGHMYNVAERDGSVIGLMYDGVPHYQGTHSRNAHFNVRNFVVLGSIDRGQTAALAVWKKSGVTTIQQTLERELILGADSTASVQYLIPQALNRAASTKFKIVSGYKGAAAVFLAMERNEIDGLFINFATIARHRPQWIKDLNFLGQLGEESDPALGNVPQVYELAKTEVDKEAIKFLIYTRITGDAVIAPPGVPADRAAALRQAFEAMVR